MSHYKKLLVAISEVGDPEVNPGDVVMFVELFPKTTEKLEGKALVKKFNDFLHKDDRSGDYSDEDGNMLWSQIKPLE